jgi:hypothetical protein
MVVHRSTPLLQPMPRSAPCACRFSSFRVRHVPWTLLSEVRARRCAVAASAATRCRGRSSMTFTRARPRCHANALLRLPYASCCTLLLCSHRMYRSHDCPKASAKDCRVLTVSVGVPDPAFLAVAHSLAFTPSLSHTHSHALALTLTLPPSPQPTHPPLTPRAHPARPAHPRSRMCSHNVMLSPTRSHNRFVPSLPV